MDLLDGIVKCLGMRLSNQTSRVTFASAREIEAHVLLNLVNELGKRDKMRGLSSI